MREQWNRMLLFLGLALAGPTGIAAFPEGADTDLNRLRQGFASPPESSRPGVYWYFMDGNLSKAAMTADLESMKEAGIGNLVFLEVNVGIPRGKVDFLSEEWQEHFVHAVREAERLGIAITLGVGPGWTGSGGPWVSGAQSMKHLVASGVSVNGGSRQVIALPKPAPRKPYFGERTLTPELKKQWLDYYEDVAVLAFPTPAGGFRIQDVDEKALYYRAPYTSVAGVKPFLPSLAGYDEPPKDAIIPSDRLVDLTRSLKDDGTLEWEVPGGSWTILRLGSRNNGAVTRPAPAPGLGFEADKFDREALMSHLESFTGRLLRKTGLPRKELPGGLKMLHMDSWEMGAQNWSRHFREEFRKRRGYDPLPYYPVYAGYAVESLEKSERFLWDLRQTAQELVIENHAGQLKAYGQKYNLGLSIEPYDMNPTADMELGALADVPMAEFWSKGYGFNSAWSCLQAASIAHIEGKKVVAAEAFTAHKDAWRQYPGSMKNQGDWAFAAGINRLVYHTFQHQFLPESLKPGMTMGPYGVHHDRSQTWWPMADGYHRYISRCQFLLQQGRPVADLLYLTPEGAPQVFRAPASALRGEEALPDRRGFNFDGCAPSQLRAATVRAGKIVFPSGASYRLLVLPASQTMTPGLLEKIGMLVRAGASILGNPPGKSPSLADGPEGDLKLAAMVKDIWGGSAVPSGLAARSFGQGKVFWGEALSGIAGTELYPDYEMTASLLRSLGMAEAFQAGDSLRYAHHSHSFGDLFFVSNTTGSPVSSVCAFRASRGEPELWDPMTGEIRPLADYRRKKEITQIPLFFEAFQSYFVFFQGKETRVKAGPGKSNFPALTELAGIAGPWEVSFDPRQGGPGEVVFPRLEDWTRSRDEGIRYYSGIARYRRELDLSEDIKAKNRELYLDLGEVNCLARVRLNGRDLGVVWSAPYRVKITEAVLPGKNRLEIEVANLWPNRLIGDERRPDDGIKNGRWPDWLLRGESRTSGRFTFTTARFYQPDSELLKSGWIGPARLLEAAR